MSTDTLRAASDIEPAGADPGSLPSTELPPPVETLPELAAAAPPDERTPSLEVAPDVIPTTPPAATPAEDDFITRHYQKAMSVQALVFGPADGRAPQRAVISFSAMSHNRFDRWSWLRDRAAEPMDDTLYIVLRDPDYHYYIGTNAEPVMIRTRRFIEQTLAKHGIPLDQTVAMGSSMGGSAAIYFSFWLGLRGAIAVNPQVTHLAAQMHSQDMWDRKIRECEARWCDLNRWIWKWPHRPRVILRAGLYPADHEAANDLADALIKRRVPHLREFEPVHTHDTTFARSDLGPYLTHLFTMPVEAAAA